MIFLDARYLFSLIDESKQNWPIEPLHLILTEPNGEHYTTADLDRTYNQVFLNEH